MRYPTVSFQTLRLSRGRHSSPGDGTCVAELVSMLAGERYSDRPRCACPALTAFLRGYNDGLDDAARQDLLAIAPEIVDTRGCEEVHRRRGDELVALAWRYERRVGLMRVGPVLNFPTRLQRYEAAGAHLGRCARTQPDCHRAVLATVRRLAGLPRLRDPRIDDARPGLAGPAPGVALEPVVGDRFPDGGVVDEGAPARADAGVLVEG